jgi:hypothetical protein
MEERRHLPEALKANGLHHHDKAGAGSAPTRFSRMRERHATLGSSANIAGFHDRQTVVSAISAWTPVAVVVSYCHFTFL